MGKITIGSDISTPIKETPTPVVSVTYDPLPPINLTESKIVEVIKEIPVYITKIEKEYIEVPVEKIVEVVKEVPVEVVRYVAQEVEVIKEVPKNVEVFIERLITQEVKIVPKWAWCLMFVELLIIVFK